ncbi:MAG: hypothetical protein RQ741_00935, partial [Wenzhouxiangellaceae bacterium]|nr:hypothetical protein [Wenzhouxiangellaceae bacterium]
MKFPMKTHARQLCTGAALVLATVGFSAQAVAQSGCGGSIGISTDPNTILDPIQFTGYPQGEPVAITVNPAAGNLSLPLTVGGVRYALTCADNGDRVPCSFGNDTGAASGEIPITFAGLATDPGTCGVTAITENSALLGPGTLEFDFPAQALDQEGCTINFNVIVNDRGTDGTPLRLTPAAEANGICEVDGGSPIAGDAAGSAIIRLVTVPDIELLKQISTDGGTTWFDADDAANAPYAEFPSGAEYRLLVSNTGTADLVDVTVNDSTLGITDVNIGDLAVGQSVTLDSGDITALSQAQVCDSGGTYENLAMVTGTSADDGSSVTDDDPANLVCVGIGLEKTADDIGKVGDVVDYRISLINNSGFDLNNCTATDTLLDTGFTNQVLPVAGEVLNLSRAVQGSDPDPLINQASLNCEVVGPVNSVNLVATDSAETDLFQPSVSVSKTGPELAKAGDIVTYTVTLENTSSMDTPDAISCSANDSLAGTIEGFGFGANSYEYTIPAGATGSIVNTVTVECGVAEFTNVFGASASHTVDLFTADASVSKTGPEQA